MSYEVLDVADGLYRAGRYAEAQSKYRDARRLRSDPAFLAYIDLNIAQCLRRQGYSSEAALQSQRGLKRLQGARIETHVELLITLANALADLQRYAESLEVLREASDLAHEMEYRPAWQQCEIGKARGLMGTSEFKAAETVLEALLAEHDVDSIVKSQALGNLAIIAEKMQNYDRARSLYEEDLIMHGTLNDESGRAATLINLATLELRLGNSQHAKILLQSAREAATRANAPDLIARVALLEDE